MSNGYAAIDKTNWYPGTRYFTQVTEENHAAWLYIIALLSFIYLIIAFIIRFIVKYGMYGHDDWAVLAATVLAYGQYIATLLATTKGLGKAFHLLHRDHLQQLLRYCAAHAYLFALAHCCSKISTAVLTQRLFENGRRRNSQVCWALIVASASFGVVAVLAFSVECQNAGYVIDNASCPHRFRRWQVIMAVDLATELLLLVVPIVLLLDVLIKPSAKMTVTAVFAVRLFTILFAVLNLVHIAKIKHASDVALGIIPTFLWTQTELFWSIIAASLPCLKSFMRPFDKVDESTWRTHDQYYSSAASGRSGRSWRDNLDQDGIMPLGKLKANRDGKVLSALGPESVGLRPDVAGNDVQITGPDGGSEEIRQSWGSQERIIIKKQEDFEVTIESNGGRPHQTR